MSSEPGQVQALCREQESHTCYDKMEGKTREAHFLWGLFIMSSPESFAGGKIKCPLVLWGFKSLEVPLDYFSPSMQTQFPSICQ